MINLAHALGLRVVAEGVETEQQAARLKAMGCEMAQGYQFYRPVSAEAATFLLANGA
jgi:EAL domain-containing protein (putative c-di-GMP-specific phosphodiesterase class I)